MSLDHRSASPIRLSADTIFPDTEMGRLCRSMDWAATALGPVDAWPLGLRLMAAQVLRQGLPQCLCWGPDLRQIYNDAFRVLMGNKHPAGLGAPVLDVWSEVADTVGPLFARVHAGETVTLDDLHLRVNRAGRMEDVWVTFSYSPVLDERGEIAGALINCVETTGQVAVLEQANQQLQDNMLELEAQTEELQTTAAHLEERTEEAEMARRTASAIVEAVTDGFVAYDGELRYTYVNGRAAEMWGMSPSHLLGKRPDELWPELKDSPFVNLLHRVLETGQPEVLEGYSASLRAPIELRAYPSTAGGIVAFFADLSEQRRAEAAATFLADASEVLASSGDYQTTLANVAAAAVPRLGDWCAVDVITDPDAGAWPPRIERVAVVHQDPTKVAMAKRLTTLFPQDWSRDTGTPGVIRSRQPMFIPDVTDAMLAGGAQSEQHLALLRELHFRSIIIVPLVARDRVLGALTLVMAESERRFTPADLALAVDLGRRAGIAVDNARLLRDADAANAAKTEFLRTVSHELRQPLNAIRGYLDLWQLGLRGEIPAALQEDVDRLARNQAHLGVLIEDLLSFTRLDAGELAVERVPVAIAPLFRTLEAMMLPQMKQRGVELLQEPCDPAIAALGDEDRIVQVCVNLLTNAMRATPAGGHVVLACVATEDQVAITVTDTGIGIPADKLESIFTPFTQLGRALNAPREGAGLGLAISRGLAEAMDGTLTVTSAPGEGSTFSLRLARAPSPK